MSAAVGRRVHRVDGPDKVTGRACYATEIAIPDIAHAAIVGARVPSGRVTGIDAAEAIASDGVLAVLTHDNLVRVADVPNLVPSLAGTVAPGESFFPMQDDMIHYAGQPVALVVADSHEGAQCAASLVDVSYETAPFVGLIEQGRDSAYEAERLFGGLLPGTCRLARRAHLRWRRRACRNAGPAPEHGTAGSAGCGRRQPRARRS